MGESYPRLVGDIGGTHARWAWLPRAGAPLQQVQVQPCARSASLLASAREYLAAHRLGQPRAAAIGIATPVTGDEVRMTNHPWHFSISELQRALGVERCLVINDFTALALSLPVLGADEVRAVGRGTAVAGAPIGLLGPGTGLGVSGLLPAPDGRFVTLSGEGGHVTLAATDDREAAVLALLRGRFGHVSAERVLSGGGLVNLYDALARLDGVAPRELQPADVTRAAVDGSDPHGAQAVRLFARVLGNVDGNLALTLGARGGIYIGGGIVPRLGAAFDDESFRQGFEHKGRFAGYLAAIPTWVITAATPALVGAGRALDVMPA